MVDLGCGETKQHGWIGMDKRALPEVDVVHDLEIFPWPLEDDSCTMLKASHLVEHIKPWLQIDFMNECWRVLEEGGILIISTPYGHSYRFVQDPTHCSPWNESTPEYFDPRFPFYYVYKPKPWEILKGQFYWNLNGDIELAMKKVKNGFNPPNEQS